MPIKGIVRQLPLIAICFLLPGCSRQSITPLVAASKSNLNQVQLSANAAELAKIASFKVANKVLQSQIETTGQIKADENRVFHINSIVAGRVVKDNVALGNVIKPAKP